MGTDNGEKSFEQVYMENRSLLYEVAMQRLNNPALAEDMVGEAFLSLFQNFEKYSRISGSKMRALCVTILENKIISYYRRTKFRSDRELEEYMLADGCVYPSPEEQSLQSEHDRRVDRLLRQLPEIYQQTLILRYYYDYSRKEIAALQQVSKRTVDKRISIGKQRLRRLLDEEE